MSTRTNTIDSTPNPNSTYEQLPSTTAINTGVRNTTNSVSLVPSFPCSTTANTNVIKKHGSEIMTVTTTGPLPTTTTATTTTWNPTPTDHTSLEATKSFETFSPFAPNHQWIQVTTAGVVDNTTLKQPEAHHHLQQNVATATAAVTNNTTNGCVLGTAGGSSSSSSSSVIHDPLANYHPVSSSLTPHLDSKNHLDRSNTPGGSKQQVTWEQRYEDLKKFRSEHGHCNVPQRWKEDKGLGVWIKTQRSNFRRMKEGRASSLTAERIHALTRLGFEWEIGKNYEVIAWEDRLDDLKEFKKVHGHCNVPQRWKENRGLGVWIKTQRSYYRKFKQGAKSSSLTAERVKALQDLGFEWELGKSSEDSTWAQRLEALKKFKAKHGHCNVPQRYKEDRSLGTWIKLQRSSFRQWKEGKPSRMTPSRIHELSVIGFEFEFTKVWPSQNK